MADGQYPDVIDKRRTTYVHPEARLVWWVTLLLIVSVVGILYLLSHLGERAAAGGEHIYGYVWLTRDRLILSPNWLNRRIYRTRDGQPLTIEIPCDAIANIERRTLTIIVTTADRQVKFTPLKAKEVMTLLESHNIAAGN